MTHTGKILFAVNEFRKQGKYSFSREDIRAFLGMKSTYWSASFSPVLQGMRVDQPGGAPAVGERYRNVFKRLSRGVYILTGYGVALVKEMFGQQPSSIRFATPESQTVVNSSNANPYPLHRSNLTKPQNTNTYSNKVQQILENAEIYHQAYYQSENFGKPCLYFHLRALKTRQNPISVQHLEYVYATLIAWGMNRPGKRGSKMMDFKPFSENILKLEENITKARNYDCFSMNEIKWAVLEKIFKGIQVMVSGTSLVGNSKVMHHLLPNIIPPIDRQYTLRFLHGNTNIRNDLDNEWLLMRKIITFFFIPVASDEKFHFLANDWINRTSEFPWDTSELKIIDNIIIGSMKKEND
jgi:hypothetical protein